MAKVVFIRFQKYQEQVSSSSTPLKPTVSSPTDQTAGTSGKFPAVYVLNVYSVAWYGICATSC